MSDDVSDAINAEEDAKAARDAVARMKDEKKKTQELQKAIRHWDRAYNAAKKFDEVGAEIIKEEKATDYRAIKDFKSAAETEEETAKALVKAAARANTAKDPKRAQELYIRAAAKLNQAASDRTQEPNAAQAGVDTEHANAATADAKSAQQKAEAATPPGGQHP
jgi:hypothetical protein